MTAERPHVDAQAFTDTELHVYEAIANLEQAGRPPTAAEIAEVTGLDDGTLGSTLRGMRERGILLPAGRAGQEMAGPDRYELARHDWSVAQDKPDRLLP
jgi:hypothetical protein